VHGNCTIAPPPRRACETTDADQARLLALWYHRLLASRLLSRTQMTRMTSPHPADWWFQWSDLQTCPGRAVDCSAGNTVWHQWYTQIPEGRRKRSFLEHAKIKYFFCCDNHQREFLSFVNLITFWAVILIHHGRLFNMIILMLIWLLIFNVKLARYRVRGSVSGSNVLPPVVDSTTGIPTGSIRQLYAGLSRLGILIASVINYCRWDCLSDWRLCRPSRCVKGGLAAATSTSFPLVARSYSRINECNQIVVTRPLCLSRDNLDSRLTRRRPSFSFLRMTKSGNGNYNAIQILNNHCK